MLKVVAASYESWQERPTHGGTSGEELTVMDHCGADR